MREIKFRAWDSQAKRMLEVVTLSFMKMTGSLTHVTTWDYRDIDELTKINFPDKINLMQYTGLKDKNGKEIYVGDIVKIFTVTGGKFQDERRLEEIHWWNSGFCRGIKDVQGLPLWWLDKDTQKFEVVGNIYENPELLKEKK